jgi:hypothetical protein
MGYTGVPVNNFLPATRSSRQIVFVGKSVFVGNAAATFASSACAGAV